MRPTAVALLALGLILAIPPGGAQNDGGSPHGDDFDLDCVKCHSEEGWTPIRKKPNFKHRAVGRSLAGSHKRVACRSCHLTLEFAADDAVILWARGVLAAHPDLPAILTTHGYLEPRPPAFYNELATDKSPKSIRLAALRGKLYVAGGK